MAQWEKSTLSDLGVGLPADVDTVFNNLIALGDSVNAILGISVSNLEALRAFIITTTDPIKALLLFICNQILLFVNEIRGTGFHFITLYPQKYIVVTKETIQVERIVNGVPTTVEELITNEVSLGSFKKFRDILPGFEDTDERGMMLLNTTEIFDAFLASFGDIGDINRPGSIDTTSGELLSDVQAGAVVFFFGTAPNELNELKRLVDLFATLFNLLSLKTLAGLLNVTPPTPTTPIPIRKPSASTSPDWSALKLVDMIPPLGDALDSMSNFLDGIKQEIDKSSDDLNSVINHINTVINTIQDIIDNITTLQDLLRNFVDRTTNINYLIIDPQPNGVDNIKSVINNATNKPADFEYCFLMSIVGAGTGFSLLMSMLGLGEFQTGVDSETLFDDDKLRDKFGIKSNPIGDFEDE